MIWKLLSVALIASATCAAASAQSGWPTKPIRIVVPFAPGSFTDTAARVVGSELSKQLKQPVVVENHGGAGSTIGTEIVAHAKPDGYTFLLTDNSFAVSAALYEKLPYKPFKDFAQVSLVAEAPAVLVARTNLPTKTLKATLDEARAHPDTLTFGSGGTGSSAHLAMELLLLQAHVKARHIPYKGVAASITDIVAQRIDIGIGSVGSTAQYIVNGRLMGLAVSGSKRHPMFPQVPTFAEAGFPDYQMMYRFGVMAPAKTPPAIIDRMQKEIAHALESPQVNKVFGAAGVQPTSSSSSNYAKQVRDESAMWKDVIHRANIKME
ncbi:tripartite tricarboxylate transporter substrate binding protein [Paralcaligenes ginsengisoli]